MQMGAACKGKGVLLGLLSSLWCEAVSHNREKYSLLIGSFVKIKRFQTEKSVWICHL